MDALFLCGEERNTMRRVCLAIRSRTRATVFGGAVHTRNTESTSCRDLSMLSGRVRSPRTTSTCDGKRAVSGLRVRARTCPGGLQLREHLAADVAGTPDHEHSIHSALINKCTPVHHVGLQAVSIQTSLNCCRFSVRRSGGSLPRSRSHGSRVRSGPCQRNGLWRREYRA